MLKATPVDNSNRRTPLRVPMRVLIPSIGVTSIKYQIIEFPSEQVVGKGRRDRVSDYRQALLDFSLRESRIDGVAFKTVHAGPRYRGTHRIDQGVKAALEKFLPAAPVHNQLHLSCIRAFEEVLPKTPMVAAFETEFHKSIPDHAARYGIPPAWGDADEIRRYGFHGASHQFVCEAVPLLLRRASSGLRLVSCHLGGSSSMCAILNGRSVDVTMGFSPQSGLESATRHGDIDLFAVLYIMERNGWDLAELRRQLLHEGGLASLSGIPGGDVRDLEQAAYAGNASAELALSVYCLQVKKAIGAFAAAMGGLDAIAFTGGVGERSAALRTRCCQGLEFLGISLDDEYNEVGTGDRVISTSTSSVQVAVLSTNEELIVGRRAYALLKS